MYGTFYTHFERKKDETLPSLLQAWFKDTRRGRTSWAPRHGDQSGVKSRVQPKKPSYQEHTAPAKPDGPLYIPLDEVDDAAASLMALAEGCCFSYDQEDPLQVASPVMQASLFHHVHAALCMEPLLAPLHSPISMQHATSAAAMQNLCSGSHPMDLTTLNIRISGGEYLSMHHFASDVLRLECTLMGLLAAELVEQASHAIANVLQVRLRQCKPSKHLKPPWSWLCVIDLVDRIILLVNLRAVYISHL